MSYGTGLKAVNETCDAIPQTIRERLVQREKRLTDQLADVKKALEFIDKNPDFEAFHDLIGKTGW